MLLDERSGCRVSCRFVHLRAPHAQQVLAPFAQRRILRLQHVRLLGSLVGVRAGAGVRNRGENARISAMKPSADGCASVTNAFTSVRPPLAVRRREARRETPERSR